MIFKGVEVVCPACKGELRDEQAESWRCASCERAFPFVAGVPDLRLFPDPYIGPEDDRAKGLKIEAASAGKSFEELIDHYYAMTDVVPEEDARMYKRGLLAAAARAGTSLDRWEAEGDIGPDRTRLLDVGCGTGPLLVAAKDRYAQVVGVDVAFRWLVMGRKRLEAAGMDAPLICANAEALPFRDGQFDVATMDSVLEHCRDHGRVASETHRVLVPGGHWCVSTPNRFSVGPDPHTGLLMGSLLPASWTARYARSKGAIPPVRTLLSAAGLKRLMREQGFGSIHTFLPGFSKEQRAHFTGVLGLAIAGYEVVRSTPGLRAFLFWIGPLVSAVARTPEARP